jgi:multidrug resistance efflux pump
MNENAAKESAWKKRMPLLVAAGLVLVVGGAIAGVAYYAVAKHEVYTDKATVSAPTVVLSPSAPGTLNAVYVNAGDVIPPNTVVAEVGTELLKSTTGGLVVDADKNIGANVAAGTAIVTTVDPNALRVVGQVDEDKGLSKIRVGDSATFTVDAFGGETFTGIVDEVSPTSHASGVVFNISDQRQTQTFDVKVRYDVAAHPELKNGMSARLTIRTE